LLTDGSADQLGWREPLLHALRAKQVESVESVSVVGAIGLTARNLLEMGAERVRQELKVRRGNSERSALEELKSSNPDVIVVDSPQNVRALQLLRDALPMDPVIIGLIPDLALYRDWSQAQPDAWILASSALSEALGLPSDSPTIEYAGPPVSAQFEREFDRTALREQAGLDPEAVVCFTDAETMRPDTIERLLSALARLSTDVDFLFYYGRNSDAANQLRRIARERSFRANMFGYTPNLERYVALSDVGIVGGGNRRLSGYLAAQLPMFAVDSAHELSAAASDGAVVALAEPDQARFVLEEIAEEGVAAPHRDAVDRLAQRIGVNPVVDAIERLVVRRDTIQQSNERLRKPVEGTASTSANSPFEVIGDRTSSGSSPQSRPPMNRAEAKERLARLIMDERRVEDEVEQAVRERDKWLERKDLANEEGDDDLASYAEGQLDQAFESLKQLREELDRISSEKLEIRKAVARSNQRSKAAPETPQSTPEGRSYEERFRKLEMKRDIDRLRDKARKDKGDDE
jgi:hypothetical protein